jgi:hypothetical protein
MLKPVGQEINIELILKTKFSKKHRLLGYMNKEKSLFFLFFRKKLDQSKLIG